MVCDPQLTQQEREAAFEQQRTAGAQQAIRPFSGKATAENLVDYLNREVFPVLKQTRKAVNDVYRPVLDNAPSANPLTYFFKPLSSDTLDWVFDGVDDRVDYGDVLHFERTSPFTLSVWFRTDSASGQFLIDNTTSSNPRGYQLLIRAGGQPAFILANNNTGSANTLAINSSVVGFDDGTLHNFLVSYAGNSLPGGVVFYMDGAPLAMTTLVSNLSATTVGASRLAVGAREDGAVPFAGLIRHAAVWQAALNSTQAAEVYGGGTPPDLNALPTAPAPVFWSRLDADDTLAAGGVVDYGSGGNNGTAEGGLTPTFSGATVSDGQVALSGVPQSGTDIVRVSETNSHLKNVFSWLQVMDGSASSPLGVVTVSDVHDPGRFIRFNLTAVADQGTYWDLTVVPLEASHANPFVVDEELVVSFIAGVAGGGVPAVAGLGGISAGTNSASSGTVVLSNSNNVSFGMNTAGVVTASAVVRVSAGTTSNTRSDFTFSNSNNVSFGMNSNGIVTATATVATSLTNIRVSAGTTSNLLSALTFANGGGVSFGLNASTLTATVATSLTAINVSAGTTSNLLSAITFSNLNNVSFGINASVVTAQAGDSRIAFVSHIGGNVVGNVTQLAFSNASNVTWSLSTAANAATVIASVAAGGGGLTAINLSAGTTSNNLSAFTLSNSNNVSFGLNGSVVTATATVASTADPQIGLVSHIGGNSQTSVTRLAFSNASNVTWSLSTAANAVTVLASVAAGGAGGIAASAAGNSVSNGTVVWSNSNNVSFGMAGSTVTATATVASTQASIRISAGTTSALSSGFTFSNSNNVSFGINAGVVTATATVASSLSNIRVSAGTTSNLLSAVTFSNSNGVSFGLDASTLTASVNAFQGDQRYWRNFHIDGDVQQSFSWANNSFLHLFPLNPHGGAWGAPMNLEVLDLMVSGTNRTTTVSTWGITWRFALYALENSTLLSRVNSGTTAFSTTTLASSDFNNQFSGIRWVSLTAWQTSPPVLSAGANYWLGVALSTVGISDNLNSVVGMQANEFAFRGFVGVAQSNNQVTGRSPFWGWISSGGMPASISAIQMQTLTSQSQFVAGMPALQFRSALAYG